MGRHISICVIWGSTAPLLPGIVFTVGHEEMIYSSYLIAQSERHFARLIRMNFTIYNRNFAHQTRQRVIWKTLQYPHDKKDRVQTHATKWANNTQNKLFELENFQNRLEELQKHLRERISTDFNNSNSLLQLITLWKRERSSSSKNVQEEKPFCPLSRNINHQLLALKTFLWNTGNL